MKIDFFKLNNLGKLDLDNDLEFTEDYYTNTDIRNIKNAHITGSIKIEYDDEIYINAIVTGTFVLPCAISLEDVDYDFKTEIEESMGNFNDFYEKNKNTLDILPIIWENIVSEVPIRVVKEGIEPKNLKGDNWELVVDND